MSLRVLPFSVGVHQAIAGGFQILQFADEADLDVVYLESHSINTYLEGDSNVSPYEQVFNSLSRRALSEADSAARSCCTRVDGPPLVLEGRPCPGRSPLGEESDAMTETRVSTGPTSTPPPSNAPKWWQDVIAFLIRVVMAKRPGPTVGLALLMSLPLATMVVLALLVSRSLTEFALAVVRNPQVGTELILLGLAIAGAIKAARRSAGRRRRW